MKLIHSIFARLAPALLRIWTSVPMRPNEVGQLSATVGRRRALTRIAGDSGITSELRLYISLSARVSNLTSCQSQNWRNYIEDSVFLAQCDFIGNNRYVSV